MAGDISLTEHVATYISRSYPTGLAEEVNERVKRHFLDGLAAVISGSALLPGRLAGEYVESLDIPGPCTVVGSPFKTVPEFAALANGMSGHADETDDIHDLARIHPGCSIIPAAIASGETVGASGKAVLEAVAVGYDVGCALPLAAWDTLADRQAAISGAPGLGQTFGASAASARVLGFNPEQNADLLSYAGQLSSGTAILFRDPHHIEKAFSMGGMMAKNGALAAELVRAGFSAVPQALDTAPNVFSIIGKSPQPERLVGLLDGTPHIFSTDMKMFPIGGPIQTPLQALLKILARRPVAADEVGEIRCFVAPGKGRIVDNRDMPDICLQHILSVAVLDGGIGFASAHDYERMADPDVLALRSRVRLVFVPEWDPSGAENESSRKARVEIDFVDGATESEYVDPMRGSRLNPLDWDEVITKARDILGTVMRKPDLEELIRTVQQLEDLGDVRELTSMISAGL